MTKKTIIAIWFFLMSFSLTEIQNAESQNSVYPLASGIFIMSPSSTTYDSELLVLNTSVNVVVGTNVQVSMNYSIDGTENKTLTTKTYTPDNSFLKQIIGSTTLPNLINCPHNITVYAKYTINNKIIGTENSTVHFLINNTTQQIPEFSTQNILMITILATTVILVSKNHKRNKLF